MSLAFAVTYINRYIPTHMHSYAYQHILFFLKKDKSIKKVKATLPSGKLCVERMKVRTWTESRISRRKMQDQDIQVKYKMQGFESL